MWLWVLGLVVIVLLLVGVGGFAAIRRLARAIEAQQWQWRR